VFARLRALIDTWRGRALLATLLVVGTSQLGVVWPALVSVPAWLLFVGYVFVYGFRASVWLLQRLLWKIRTKLLLSYLFIAVVPVVLLSLFFFVAGLLFSGLLASAMVTAELERKTLALRTLASSTLSALPPGEAFDAKALEQRLAPLALLHPQGSWAYVCGTRTRAQGGQVPAGWPERSSPAWWHDARFAGLVSAQSHECLRVVERRGDCALFLDLPIDLALFAELRARTGIVLLTAGGSVRVNAGGRGVRIDVDDENFKRLGTDPEAQLEGQPFPTTVERTEWASGQKDVEPLTFLFNPRQLLRRLSPSTFNMADMLVRALALLGIVFLVMYGVALLFGLGLARSITGSVHALSRGTQRLRQGDFDAPIRVRSRDQLGELAESFNLMAVGIKDLLRGQAEKERLEEELRIARQIQMSLLPQSAVTVPGLRVAALCLPAAEVGGDYYDLLPLGATRLGVLVADVSGKGTSAALYMAELKGLALSLSRVHSSPGKLLSEANRILAANTDSRTFVTMTYAVVDVEAGVMRFARAGHNPLLHLEARSGRARLLTPPGIGLGLDRGERFDQVLQEVELKLASGDVFLFFTDGLSEAMNAASELFGESRLQAVLEQSEALTTEELRERILEEIRVFVGDEAQHDDMTLVILQVA
jgi:serine phosphatase RsbU (regulator of sigma subunit)